MDVVHVPRWGRRKSWIVPCQILISCLLLCLAERVDIACGGWVSARLGVHSNPDVLSLTAGFTLLVLAAATQDIGVNAVPVFNVCAHCGFQPLMGGPRIC